MSITRRAKIATGATIVGLGALGGVALGSNHGVPAYQRAATTGSGSIVTSASGATAVPAGEAIPVSAGSNSRAPIVTRASGGAAPSMETDD